MSKEFNDKLFDMISSPDNVNNTYDFVHEHLPTMLSVCSYRLFENGEWKFGILVDVDIMDDNDDMIYVNFLQNNGVVDNIGLWCDDEENAYHTIFFTDMDDNLKVIKQCDSLLEAATVLSDIMRDGPEVLKEL